MTLEQWIEQCQQIASEARDVLGRAWATVDLERALADAGDHGARAWEPVEDELLGARGLRLVDADPAVIVLEPSTEGRLAGWLARNGEGEAAIYRERAGVPATARMTALGRPGRWAGPSAGLPRATRMELFVMRPGA